MLICNIAVIADLLWFKFTCSGYFRLSVYTWDIFLAYIRRWFSSWLYFHVFWKAGHSWIRVEPVELVEGQFARAPRPFPTKTKTPKRDPERASTLSLQDSNGGEREYFVPSRLKRWVSVLSVPSHPHSTVQISSGKETSRQVREKSCLLNVVQMEPDETRHWSQPIFFVSYYQNFFDTQKSCAIIKFLNGTQDLLLGFEFWKEVGAKYSFWSENAGNNPRVPLKSHQCDKQVLHSECKICQWDQRPTLSLYAKEEADKTHVT